MQASVLDLPLPTSTLSANRSILRQIELGNWAQRFTNQRSNQCPASLRLFPVKGVDIVGSRVTHQQQRIVGREGQ
jgi:hypothetical protein